MHGSGDPEVRAGQRLYGSRNAQMNIREARHAPITTKRSMNNFLKCGIEVCHLCKGAICLSLALSMCNVKTNHRLRRFGGIMFLDFLAAL